MQTILNLWKKNFKNNKNKDFLYDNILGLQTKKDFILKAYFIAGKLEKIEGEKIGIMLPALGGASLLILATYLAGKIPVMFNWTLPENAFSHCVDFSQVDKIISSKSFFDRVKTPFLEKLNTPLPASPLTGERSNNDKGKFIFLEDLLKTSSIFEKMQVLFKSIFMPIPEQKQDDIAVLLFTSGSESLPKAVPLTHKNLISNIYGAISIFKVQKDDILLGFLPPFHSFGFTVNTIMPLITGIRVVYTPDPNDAKTILEIIKHTKPTALTATPTFLKMIMSLANKGDLYSIKYAVVGAEKCPKGVFDKFRELCPNGKILEGYGITECSPVVAINPIDGAKPGTVGKIINCLDCKIVKPHPNPPLAGEGIEQVECEVGEQGMILVKGKSIFGGYLDKKIESPFIPHPNHPPEGPSLEQSSIHLDPLAGEGKEQYKWYKTGDLGFLDEDNFLTITGRLKRFIKIAGEMISLPAIEEVLMKKYGSDDELKIAIEALEKDGQAKIVLFSLEKIDLDQAQEFMRNNGIPNLVKIEENIVIDEIPVLGTGKTDYKVLKGMIRFEK